MECKRIAAVRAKFLHTRRLLGAEKNWPVALLDETWVSKNHTNKVCFTRVHWNVGVCCSTYSCFSTAYTCILDDGGGSGTAESNKIFWREGMFSAVLRRAAGTKDPAAHRFSPVAAHRVSGR